MPQRLRNSLKRLWQTFSFRETLIFLLFLILAGLIWYGHAMNSVRGATLPVKITYNGIPDNVLFGTPLPDCVQIELRDAGSRLHAYGHNLELTFDLSAQLQDENGTVTISQDQLRNSINTLLQGTTKLQSVTPELLQASYYRQHSKQVPIKLIADATPAAQYQFIGEPQLSPSHITVFGQRHLLDSLQEVTTCPITVPNIKDTLITTATLDLPEGLRVVSPNIRVMFITEQFTEKTFTLPIIARHVPEDTHLRLFPAEVTVHLRIGVAHFNDISEKDVQVWCNYPTTHTDRLFPKVKCTNPYVTFSRTTPASVEFLIEKIN